MVDPSLELVLCMLCHKVDQIAFPQKKNKKKQQQQKKKTFLFLGVVLRGYCIRVSRFKCRLLIRYRRLLHIVSRLLYIDRITVCHRHTWVGRKPSIDNNKCVTLYMSIY